MAVDAGTAQAIVAVLGVFGFLIVCSLFKSRPDPEAFSPQQLDEIRIRRESEKEGLLEEKAHRLQERARMHRHNRLLLTARKDTGLLLQGAQERWDAKGRSIYGDAWDQPDNGNLPLRELFNLPKEEIDTIREEARMLVVGRQGGSLSALSDSLPTPPTQARNDEHRARTAFARRGPTSSRPSPAAPYVDARFVNASPAPPVVPPLDFSQLRNNGGFFPIAKLFQEHHRPSSEATATAALAASQNIYLHHGDLEVALPAGGSSDLSQGTDSRRTVHAELLQDNSALAFEEPIGLQRGVTKTIAASLQQPGLSRPRPPDVPVPGLGILGATGRGPTSSERESLSARLARLAGGGNSGRVVPLELV